MMPLIGDPIDFELDADNDLVIDTDLHFTSGVQAVAQGIRLRFTAFRGEWFLDLDNGIPYFQDILGQKYNQSQLLQIFRIPLLATPGVASIESLTSTWDGTTRTVTIAWKVMTVFGDTIEDSLPIAA